MSKRSRSSSEQEAGMDLEVNGLLPAKSSSSSSSSSSGSVENSCMSWEGEGEGEEEGAAGVEEIITRSMMLVGCPGCFMYVMLTDKSSQCPKCNNNVFLDFFKQQQHRA